MMSGLARIVKPEVTLQIAPGLHGRARVWQQDDVVFLEIDAKTPLGPVRALLSTDFESYLKMCEAAREHRVAARLSDFLEGKFGSRPVLSRIAGNDDDE